MGLFADSGDIPVLLPQHENDGDDGAAWFNTDGDAGEETLTAANAALIAAAPQTVAELARVKADALHKDELIERLIYALDTAWGIIHISTFAEDSPAQARCEQGIKKVLDDARRGATDVYEPMRIERDRLREVNEGLLEALTIARRCIMDDCGIEATLEIVDAAIARAEEADNA